jgi:hypothetical protein
METEKLQSLGTKSWSKKMELDPISLWMTGLRRAVWCGDM